MRNGKNGRRGHQAGCNSMRGAVSRGRLCLRRSIAWSGCKPSESWTASASWIWARNWRALVAYALGRADEALKILAVHASSYGSGTSSQHLLSLLLETAALAAGSPHDRTLARLDSRAALVPEWKPVADALAGRAPMEQFHAYISPLTTDVQSEICLIAGEILGFRGRTTNAEALRAKAVEVSGGRAFAMWFVSNQQHRRVTER